MRLKFFLKFFLIFTLLFFVVSCGEEEVKVVKIDKNQLDIIKPAEDSQSDANNKSGVVQQQALQNLEQNNQSQTLSKQTMTAQGADTKADLEIVDFLLSTLNSNQNEEFEVKFKIKNSGTDAISNFDYAIIFVKNNITIRTDYYNYTQILGVNSLTDKITLSYSLPELGLYDVIVKADASEKFQEPNEENNLKKQKINIIESATSSSSTTSTSTTAPSTNSKKCFESDGGKNYNVMGSCVDENTDIRDVCIDVNELWEWYCSNDRCVYEVRTCHCSEGKCL
ncbi:MAG: CARDB domain-containing protein [Candidatus Woesearchaeota archaeon]